MTKPRQDKPAPVEVPREVWINIPVHDLFDDYNVRLTPQLPMDGEKIDFDTLGKSIVALRLAPARLFRRLIPVIWWNTIGEGPDGLFCKRSRASGEQLMIGEIVELYRSIGAYCPAESIIALEEMRDWFVEHGWRATLSVTEKNTEEKNDKKGHGNGKKIPKESGFGGDATQDD